MSGVPIKDFEDYEIFCCGSVWSNKREKFLMPTVSEKGYFIVTLYNKDVKKVFYIHRLVAEYFCVNTNPEEYNVINHIDGNKFNNHYRNLEYCNQLINCRSCRKIQKNNKSGISGVSFTNKYICVSFCDDNKKLHQKYYSIKKHGFEQAKLLAEILRKQKEEEYYFK